MKLTTTKINPLDLQIGDTVIVTNAPIKIHGKVKTILEHCKIKSPTCNYCESKRFFTIENLETILDCCAMDQLRDFYLVATGSQSNIINSVMEV